MMQNQMISRILLFALLSLSSLTSSVAALHIQPVVDAKSQSVRLTSMIELELLIDLTAQVNKVEIEYPTNAFRGMSVTLMLTH